MTAWLLLLLRDSESYGRGLVGSLSERGISVEPALAYRTLRALEGEGAVTSRWTESHHGPRRRCYRLTGKGRHRLAECAASIEATWQLHDVFVRAHADLRDAHEGAEQIATGESGAGSSAPPDSREQSGHAAPAPASGSLAPAPAAPPVGRELLAAWLLLLLAEGPSYGYDLRRALAQRQMRVDPSAPYRVLQTLERDRLLQSRWKRSAAGPRRRFYQLTTQGRRGLDQRAEAIGANRERYGAFVRAYEQTTT